MKEDICWYNFARQKSLFSDFLISVAWIHGIYCFHGFTSSFPMPDYYCHLKCNLGHSSPSMLLVPVTVLLLEYLCFPGSYFQKLINILDHHHDYYNYLFLLFCTEWVLFIAKFVRFSLFSLSLITSTTH